jgi:EmrB/QacA subfamily drug resistance transporter
MADIGYKEQFERFGPAYRWLLVVAGTAGSVSAMISSTMVNVAIPSITGAFGVEQGLAQWVATAFFATMTASQLLNSWVITAVGERVAFCSVLIIFSVGAFIGATSATLETLVAGRIMQGFAAGILAPLVMSAVISVFPDERRGFAISLFSVGTIVSPGFGPFIGGLAIDTFSWRHMFLVPLPLVGIALILGAFLMPHRKFSFRNFPSFNWSGYLLLTIAIICIMGSLGNGQRWGWTSDRTLLTFLIGIISATAFVISQLHVKNPLLDPTLFLNPQFTSAVILAFVFGAATFATNYSVPVFVQMVQGFTPTKAGMILIPAGIMMMIIIPIAGWISDRVPNHIPIMLGCLMFTVAMYLVSGSDVNTTFWSIALLIMLSRSGHGIVKPNMGRAALASIPTEKINQGVGTFNFIRQLGGAFGVNIIVVIMEMRTAFHSEALTATQTAGNIVSREFLDKVETILNEAGVAEAVQHPGALNYLGKVVYAQAMTMGFQDSFMILAVVFLFVLIPAWILKRANKSVIALKRKKAAVKAAAA